MFICSPLSFRALQNTQIRWYFREAEFRDLMSHTAQQRAECKPTVREGTPPTLPPPTQFLWETCTSVVVSHLLCARVHHRGLPGVMKTVRSDRCRFQGKKRAVKIQVLWIEGPKLYMRICFFIFPLKRFTTTLHYGEARRGPSESSLILSSLGEKSQIPYVCCHGSTRKIERKSLYLP